MNIAWLKTFGFFIVLLFVQVLILNHIHLFGFAMPLLYVYFVISFRKNCPRWAVLLLSFVLGLCIDIFANTPGVASTSMTFIGFIQPYLLSLFVSRESPDDLQPSFASIGVAKYLLYTFILVLIYCLLFFSLEVFSFFDLPRWAESVGGSTVLTLLFIWVIENLINKR